MAAATLAWSSTRRFSLPRVSPVSARTALAGAGRPRNGLVMLTSTARRAGWFGGDERTRTAGLPPAGRPLSPAGLPPRGARENRTPGLLVANETRYLTAP